MAYDVITQRGKIVQDPPIARLLFSDTRMGWLWLFVRVWVGYQWIDAARIKIANPAWVETGAALKSFWASAITVPDEGSPAIAFEWYRSFIQYLLDAEAYVWFSKVVAYGELLVGIALVVGMFTGIAAFLGGFMNWNLLMAGAASTNGLLFLAAVLLIMAWKVAGFVGADYFILPLLGTPWKGKQPEEADVEIQPSPA